MNINNYIITINRQLGSGGALVGRSLASEFGFKYIDKELLIRAAETLEIPEKSLEWIEEKNFSIWGGLLQTSVCDLPFIPDAIYMPTGSKLFETQTKIIEKVTDEQSCVVIGRCGSYLFRNHPKHISIFLHADQEHRIERLKKVIGGSEDKIKKAMEKADKERDRYYSTYTGRKWLDLREYDLAINTGEMSIDEIVKVLQDYVCNKFPELSSVK